LESVQKVRVDNDFSTGFVKSTERWHSAKLAEGYS
jgi:hypothetical protein